MRAAPILFMLALPGLAGAEPMPTCSDGHVTRIYMSRVEKSRDWVEFYSDGERGDYRYERWTLLHCPSGTGVSVKGFTPFAEPLDYGEPVEPVISPEDEAIFAAIRAAVADLDVSAGAEGTEAVADRLGAAGLQAVVGEEDRGSCACDPRWS